MNIQSIMKMCCNHIGINSSTQLQEYTEVPGEAIWWHRMQEKLSAAGLCPGPRWGSLQRSPIPPSWWEGDWLPLSNYPRALGLSDFAYPVPPLQNCAPTWFRLATPLNLISATT